MSKIPASQLSDHELIVALAGYLKSQASTSQAASFLDRQLSPKLARIIEGASPSRVLHTGARGRPVSNAKQAFQNSIAGYIAWRRHEGCTKKEAVRDAARLLKISADDVLNANRAPHDVGFDGPTFSVLAEMIGKTPDQMLQAAHAAHILTAKKKPRKKPRGK